MVSGCNGEETRMREYSAEESFFAVRPLEWGGIWGLAGDTDILGRGLERKTSGERFFLGWLGGARQRGVGGEIFFFSGVVTEGEGEVLERLGRQDSGGRKLGKGR